MYNLKPNNSLIVHIKDNASKSTSTYPGYQSSKTEIESSTMKYVVQAKKSLEFLARLNGPPVYERGSIVQITTKDIVNHSLRYILNGNSGPFIRILNTDLYLNDIGCINNDIEIMCNLIETGLYTHIIDIDETKKYSSIEEKPIIAFKTDFLNLILDTIQYVLDDYNPFISDQVDDSKYSIISLSDAIKRSGYSESYVILDKVISFIIKNELKKSKERKSPLYIDLEEQVDENHFVYDEIKDISNGRSLFNAAAHAHHSKTDQLLTRLNQVDYFDIEDFDVFSISFIEMIDSLDYVQVKNHTSHMRIVKQRIINTDSSTFTYFDYKNRCLHVWFIFYLANVSMIEKRS